MIQIAIAALTLQTKMKYLFNILLICFFAIIFLGTVNAQCSVCTKTAMQLGEKPAKALNTAILYLMMMPFAIGGVIGYRWWRNRKKVEEQEATGNPQ